MSEWKEISIDQIKADSKSSIAVGPFGSKLKSEEYIESGIPVLRGTNISSSKEFSGEFVFISEEKAKALGSANVYPGDIVFPHRGAIGEVGIVNDQGNKHYVISSSLMKLTPNKDKAHSEFLYYFFKSNKGKYELLKNASTVGTPGIGQPLASLKAINLKLPPISEQKAIAHILGTLDEKIELNRKMNQTLEAMAQGLFKSWFVDFDPVIDNAIQAGNPIPEELQARAEKRRVIAGTVIAREERPKQSPDVIANPDEGGMKQSQPPLKPLLHTNPSLAAQFPASFVFSETLGKWIPEGWEVEKLKDLVDVKYGKDHKNLEDGKFPCFGSGGVMRYVEKPIFRNESVLIPRKGSLDNVMYVNTPFWSVDTMFYTEMKEEHFVKYFFYTVNKLKFSEMSEGSAVPSMTTAQLNSMDILLPSINCLSLFDKTVSKFFKKKEANEAEIEILTQLRDRLLPELISGRVRVNNINLYQI